MCNGNLNGFFYIFYLFLPRYTRRKRRNDDDRLQRRPQRLLHACVKRNLSRILFIYVRVYGSRAKEQCGYKLAWSISALGRRRRTSVHVYNNNIMHKQNISAQYYYIIHQQPVRVPYTLLRRNRSQACWETYNNHGGCITTVGTDRVYIYLSKGVIYMHPQIEQKSPVGGTNADEMIISSHMDCRSGFITTRDRSVVGSI